MKEYTIKLDADQVAMLGMEYDVVEGIIADIQDQCAQQDLEPYASQHRRLIVGRSGGDYVLLDKTGLEDFELKPIAYGFQLAWYENAFTILMSWRQDSRTHIFVTLTNIDGETKLVGDELILQGSESETINKLINKYIQEEWINRSEEVQKRIQGFVDAL